jgi:hypothetical protein
MQSQRFALGQRPNSGARRSVLAGDLRSESRASTLLRLRGYGLAEAAAGRRARLWGGCEMPRPQRSVPARQTLASILEPDEATAKGAAALGAGAEG